MRSAQGREFILTNHFERLNSLRSSIDASPSNHSNPPRIDRLNVESATIHSCSKSSKVKS